MTITNDGKRAERTRDPLLLGVVALWCAAAVAWAVLIAIEVYMSGPTSCDLAPGRSVFGVSDWSWFPLGETCTWDVDVNGVPVTIVEPPSFAMSGAGTVIALWGASLLVRTRRTRLSTE